MYILAGVYRHGGPNSLHPSDENIFWVKVPLAPAASSGEEQKEGCVEQG